MIKKALNLKLRNNNYVNVNQNLGVDIKLEKGIIRKNECDQ